jgi:glycerol-3-phosphate dehydrogenase (NAD(P)+)
MAVLTVLGAGRMGTALCAPLLDRGHHVRLVGTHLDGEYIAALRGSGVHPGLGHPLPPGASFLEIDALAEALRGADAVVLGVSSAGIHWAGRTLAGQLRPGTPVLMVTKGIEWNGEAFVTMPEAFASELPADVRRDVRPAAVSGPCLAGELVRRVQTCVVIASRDPAEAARWAELLRTTYYHVWTSTDLGGHGMSAALKNAYAIAVGFGVGLFARASGLLPEGITQQGITGAPPSDRNARTQSRASQAMAIETMAGQRVAMQSVAMHNHEAAVFAQATLELQRLVELAGGDPRLVGGLSGVGDLHVTCHGRNHQLGVLLGAGLPISQALAVLAGVSLEGLEAIRVVGSALPALEAKGQIRPSELPLLRHLHAVVEGRSPIEIPFDRFFA